MNPIVKITSGVHRGLYKWISKDAIYYAKTKASLKRRGAAKTKASLKRRGAE